jgi:hypothetical protein
MTRAKTDARFSSKVISGILRQFGASKKNPQSFGGLPSWLPSPPTMPDRDVVYAWHSVALAQAGRSSNSLHCISLAPAWLDRYPRGLTGHVALSIRSIAQAREAGEDRGYGT